MHRRRFRFRDRERAGAVCAATGPVACPGRAVRFADRRHAERRLTDRCHADRRCTDRRCTDRRCTDRCCADRRYADRCCADRRRPDHRISEHRHALPRDTSPRNSASCNGCTYSNGCTFGAADRPSWLHARAKPTDGLTPHSFNRAEVTVRPRDSVATSF